VMQIDTMISPEGISPEGMSPEGMSPEGMSPEGVSPEGVSPERDNDDDQRAASAAPLLFFHIGKTGGTSLTSYFRSLARDFHVQSVPDDYSGLELAEHTRFPDFISGHYKVATWLHRLPPSWRTMVVIRDPIQHLLSSYWHIRTHPEVSDNPGLRDLIRDARQVDFSTLLRERAGECFEEHFDNPQTRFILDKKFGPLDAQDQARAIALLGEVDFVGVTECLGEFAAQIAASMPWAVGWEEQILPRMVVNPFNSLRTEEIPRALLRNILAATEIDAELYHRARRLQSARVGQTAKTSVAMFVPPPNPEATERCIPVADLIRVFPVTTRSVRFGFELSIDDDKIMLHPPEPGEDPASVTIENIPLDRHRELAGWLMVAHEGAAPVRFDIELSQGAATLASASFKACYQRGLDIRMRFSPAAGPATLTLRTAMADGDSNTFAWAHFVGLTIN
jgi:hypothetical protein